jgi:hypothetical protein
MKTKNWKGVDAVSQGKVTVKNDWPSNYHLVFSWSEVNGKDSLDVLRKGGNVVMVFRRSKMSKSSYRLPAGMTERRTKGKFLPDTIHVAQLSKDPADHGWYANVINGDLTDLRFDDPYLVGSKEGGSIVALIAKGEATKEHEFDKADSEALWKRFTLPLSIEKKPRSRKLEGKIMVNPAEDENDLKAVPQVDSDIAQQAVSILDGYVITTTAMGT